jgi:hypothetical protein
VFVQRTLNALRERADQSLQVIGYTLFALLDGQLFISDLSHLLRPWRSEES